LRRPQFTERPSRSASLFRIPEGDELRQSAFQRREPVDDGPPIGKVYIHSPEDLILYKLICFGLSQQSKHSRDTAAILKSKKMITIIHQTIDNKQQYCYYGFIVSNKKQQNSTKDGL
jgi:hypothetical protein